MTTWKMTGACAAVMGVVMAVTVLPLCAALYSCGCSLLQGERHCNVHHAGGPHCPWCAGGVKVGGAGFGVMVTAAAGAAYAGLRWRWRVWAGVVPGLVAYFAVAVVVGYVTARVMGYPVWMGVRL